MQVTRPLIPAGPMFRTLSPSMIWVSGFEDSCALAFRCNEKTAAITSKPFILLSIMLCFIPVIKYSNLYGSL